MTIPPSGYVICCVGRSGSNWFAEVLDSTGGLGHPQDFFNTPDQRMRHGSTYPADRREQIRRILGDGMTANGIYGLKVFPVHLHNVALQLRWTEHLPNLQFVRWHRRDLLGQALSRHRANQTMQWRSTRTVRAADPVYDGEAILEAMNWIAVQNARWDVFFARNARESLSLVYEDVMKAPEEAVGAVAALVGLAEPPRLDAAKVNLAIQRDSLTEEWRARFIREFGDPDRIDEL